GRPGREVAAKTVDVTCSDPEFHTGYHAIGELGIAIIQLPGIGPVKGGKYFTRAVLFVKTWMPGQPGMVASRVIGDPVDDDLKPFFMGQPDKLFPVVHRTELGVDGRVIADRVVTAEDALAVFFANGVQ